MRQSPTLRALRETLVPVFDRYPVDGVLLYGSSADGARHGESDFDLAVLPEPDAAADLDALHDRLVVDIARALGVPEVRIDLKMLPTMPLVLRFKAFQRGQLVSARRADALREEFLRTAARYHDEYPRLRDANERFFSTLGAPSPAP